MNARLLMPAVMASMVVGGAHAEVLLGTATALSGPASSDFFLKQAIDMATSELNASGGLLGEPVRVIEVDDYCEGEQAVAAADKLVADGVAFVIGHTCSSAAIPASKVYAEAGLPMITPTATNPKLTEQGFKNIFRICGRDDLQGAIAGRLLADRWGESNIVIVHDGGAYGEGLAAQAKKALNNLGVTEVLYDKIDVERADQTDAVDRIQAAQADVLYYAGLEQGAGLLIRELRDRGDDVQLVSGDGLSSELFWTIAGEAGDGTLFTGFPGAKSLPAAADVIAAFGAADIEPSTRILLAYAAFRVWTQAVEQAGSVKPEAVIEVLHNGSFDTIYGQIGFDEKGDVTGYEPFTWYALKRGEIVPAQPTN